MIRIANMTLNPRKSKTDAPEAIKQINKDMIKMINVNTKPKTYTNESKWIDSEEFTTFSDKRMNKGRKVSPNCIKLSKMELLMELEEKRTTMSC